METSEKIELLSSDNAVDFAAIWYELADDDHFWLRWRLAVLLREIRRLGLDISAPKVGLDIGCGHGDILRKLTSSTAWHVDGCDLNKAALAFSSTHPGRILFYNINDCRRELAEAYDFVVMFDVIEHIWDTRTFIGSAAYHLKPGGLAFINVPAIQSLYSKYDEIQGHYRRYNKRVLSQHLMDGGLEVCLMRYWGMPLIPIALARKFYVRKMTNTSEIMTAGFAPPSPLVAAFLEGLSILERRLLPYPPFGTSLLAVARKEV